MRKYMIAAIIGVCLALAAGTVFGETPAKITVVNLPPNEPQNHALWFIRATLAPGNTMTWRIGGTAILSFATEEGCKFFVRNDSEVKAARDGLPAEADISCVTE